MNGGPGVGAQGRGGGREGGKEEAKRDTGKVRRHQCVRLLSGDDPASVETSLPDPVDLINEKQKYGLYNHSLRSTTGGAVARCSSR